MQQNGRPAVKKTNAATLKKKKKKLTLKWDLHFQSTKRD